eukprot:CAMPEP_0176067162 /NCGR_PEP_ID=MMETSP0120_2-20121206/33521_1 /TAXON_ID=160619 /ORGANISM="Kryptoperidinium foliaceum, Strain CCMP 1326" /LENGTH=182 /DNA_ID=CAMNT_0017400775 /DNA_START=5 /DNA_END=553 /DNA_ORIENTATION=+
MTHLRIAAFGPLVVFVPSLLTLVVVGVVYLGFQTVVLAFLCAVCVALILDLAARLAALFGAKLSCGSADAVPPTPDDVRIYAKKRFPATSISACGETCVVCLDDLAGSAPCRKLPCDHRFHAECIDTWWVMHRHRDDLTCPTCRSVLARRSYVTASISSRFLLLRCISRMAPGPSSHRAGDV